VNGQTAALNDLRTYAKDQEGVLPVLVNRVGGTEAPRPEQWRPGVSVVRGKPCRWGRRRGKMSTAKTPRAGDTPIGAI
jgi:hypothetical protein